MEIQKSRSIIVNKFGGYESLEVKSFDLPPLDDNLEIKVEYGGLNFADLYLRQGLMMDKKVPFVLGIECAGTVTAIGTENTEFSIGQKVICYNYNGGLYRDIVRISPSKCFLLPDFVDTKEGCAMFVNYLTAYYALFCLGNLKENESVLLLSCAGGIGCAATQLAKTKSGVKVFGTGSNSKEEQAKKNGVDVFFSNKCLNNEVLQKGQKYDLILTNEAGPLLSFLQTLLNPLGRIILLGANNIIANEEKLSIFGLLKAWWSTKYISPESLIMNNRVVAGLHLGLLAENRREDLKKSLQTIFELYKQLKIKPIIHSVLPMSEIVEATKIIGQRKNVGKVLIKMNA